MSNEESTIIQGYLKRMQDEYENFNTVYNDLLTKLNLAQTEYTKQDSQFKKLLTDETNLVTIYSSSTRQNFDTEFEKVQSAAQAKILNISQVPEELDEFIKLANLDLEGVRNQLNEISQNVSAIKDEANAQIDSINRELPKVTEAGQKAIEDMNKVVNQVTASGRTLQQQINELDLRLSGIVNNQSNISKDITAIQETNKAINASQEALLKLIDKTDDRIDQINQQIGDIVKIRTDIDTLKINKADKTFVTEQLAQTSHIIHSKKYIEINLNEFGDIAKKGTPEEDWSLAFNHAVTLLKGNFGKIIYSGLLKIKSTLTVPFGVDLEGASLPNSGFIADKNFNGAYMIQQLSEKSHIKISNTFLNFPNDFELGGIYIKNPYDYSGLFRVVGNNSNGDFLVIGDSAISQTLRVDDCLVYGCDNLTKPLIRLNNLQEGCFINNKLLGQQSAKATTPLLFGDGVTTTLFLNNSFAHTTQEGMKLVSEDYSKRMNANKIIGNLFELCGETVLSLVGANNATLEAEYNVIYGNDTLYQQGKVFLDNCTNTQLFDRLLPVFGSNCRRTFNLRTFDLTNSKEPYGNTVLSSDGQYLKGKFSGDYTFDVGRTKKSKISWDATPTNDYGLKFDVDGVTKMRLIQNNIVNESVNGGVMLKDADGKNHVLRINSLGQVVVTDY